MTNLYHKDIGFPKSFNGLRGAMCLRYGRHAQLAAHNDRYGKIALPYKVNLENFTVIEVEMAGAKWVKSVIRGKLDDKRDICIVVQPDGFVRTVWVNLRTDNHPTLNRSKYAVP